MGTYRVPSSADPEASNHTDQDNNTIPSRSLLEHPRPFWNVVLSPADKTHDQSPSLPLDPNTSDYDYEYGDGDEYEDSDDGSYEEWRLKLPIHGTIALRRALDRGEDLYCIEREQALNMTHQAAVKYGPLKDVEIQFREIDYSKPTQHESRMARINDGEPVSPKTKPEQMSLKEYNEAFRVDDHRDGVQKYQQEREVMNEVRADDRQNSAQILLSPIASPRQLRASA